MKIAFVDNNPTRLKKIGKLLNQYYNSQKQTIDVDLFDNASDLLDKLKNNNGYKLILINMTCGEAFILDSVIPKIRHYNPLLPIIFTNWINNESIECVFVNPQRFVINPFCKDEFFPMMNSISEQIMYSAIRNIYVKTTDKNIRMISINDIAYAEVVDHVITIHLYSGETVETLNSMKKFTEQLSVYPEFLIPHRSFIVNSIFISHISVKEICMKMSNIKIPVAKGKANIVKQKYQEFFAKYQVMPYVNELKIADIDF